MRHNEICRCIAGELSSIGELDCCHAQSSRERPNEQKPQVRKVATTMHKAVCLRTTFLKLKGKVV